MDHGDNKHCVATPWSERYFYKDNGEHTAACGVQDKPTRVQLRCKSRGYPTFDFEIPRQNHELEKLETMLQTAYNQGRSDSRIEIGEMMRNLIAL